MYCFLILLFICYYFFCFLFLFIIILFYLLFFFFLHFYLFIFFLFFCNIFFMLKKNISLVFLIHALYSSSHNISFSINCHASDVMNHSYFRTVLTIFISFFHLI